MRDILNTIFSRYLIAFLNLILIFINAKVLGVDGMGSIGLIVASVGIATVVSGIMSGNTLVYFMNKYSMKAVMLPAYSWIPIGTGIGCLIMYFSGMLAPGYELSIFYLSVLNSIVVTNSRLLLGNNDIKGFNISAIVQGGLLFFVLLFIYYICLKKNVDAYVYGLYFTNGVAAIISFLYLLPHIKRQNASGRPPILNLTKEMMAYGMWGSADNVAEFLTTRLNYFLLGKYAGVASVGLLDGGTKVSESVWHINRSIGFITYSRIAQTTDSELQKRTTLQFFKITFLAVSAVTIAILCIPEWVYTEYLFSPEFEGMRMVIVGLSGGIVALACNNILSQFFIGTGRIKYSAFSSGIGLLVLVASGYWLIPLYGATGSAVSSSIAFCCMLLYSLIMFCITTASRPNEFLIRKGEIKDGIKQIKGLFNH